VQAEIDRAEGKTWTLAGLERMAFYERARGAYCVIATVSVASMAASS